MRKGVRNFVKCKYILFIFHIHFSFLFPNPTTKHNIKDPFEDQWIPTTNNEMIGRGVCRFFSFFQVADLIEKTLELGGSHYSKLYFNMKRSSIFSIPTSHFTINHTSLCGTKLKMDAIRLSQAISWR